MLEFRQIDISDRQWINELLKKSDFMGCEYSFANNMAWRRLSDSTISRYKDFYLIKAEDDEYTSFSFPAGIGNYREVFDLLSEYADSQGKPLIITGVTENGLDVFREIYGENGFEAKLLDGSGDYIYLADDLISLKGKKYHKKRNHLAKMKNYNWQFHPMSEKFYDECIELSVISYNDKEGYDDHSSVAEQYAIHTYFTYFKELELKGGVITIDGKVRAFTIGEQLNSDTFCVHIEKADASVDGLYPAINNEFLKYAAEGFKYVNREEDLGIEGLKKSKRSYNPVFVLDKYAVKIKE